MDWQYRLSGDIVYLYNVETGYSIHDDRILCSWNPRQVDWGLLGRSVSRARKDGVNKFLSILAKEKL